MSFGTRRYSWSSEMRWRHRYSVLTVLATVALVGWGGFVTSINAGMAVPDWPASFGSFDPFRTGFHDPSDPAAQWWHHVPILAEHGHRLLGMLVGLLTMGLALWTWLADPRRWMRLLGIGALVLVSLQGVLGGLRVVWISLDLAVVHACVAQLFFALLVGMTLFTSRGWTRVEDVPGAGSKASLLRGLALATGVVLYLQIILGALLRHPGMGIDPTLSLLHIAGALIATGLIATASLVIFRHFAGYRLLQHTARVLIGLLLVQLTLGFTAYFVLLDGSGMLQPSNFQVVINTSHLLVGTFLFASSVVLFLLTWRGLPERAAAAPGMAQPSMHAPASRS